MLWGFFRGGWGASNCVFPPPQPRHRILKSNYGTDRGETREAIYYVV